MSAASQAFDALALQIGALTAAINMGSADDEDAAGELLCALEDELIAMPAITAGQFIRKLLIASGLTARGFCGERQKIDDAALFTEAQMFLTDETGGVSC
ncbi:hypothetical protein [Sphingomonas sanxanigenens]|uniref:Uncharacterized protein n=1 Tax=Sphingomonas sanxanigenens DSM 19645 = NX02 TaxID=1123269 RepID=W0AJP1_9SPHN|nr:hypothetical protein [Sphingomonas sanxanigenens]AHE55890.1 hypothetical protein NX02_21270 [Sphingomonas sanxanigenens DSM 19645 = NX02]